MNRAPNPTEKKEPDNFLPRDLGVKTLSRSDSHGSYSDENDNQNPSGRRESIAKRFNSKNSQGENFGEMNNQPSLSKQNSMVNTNIGKSILKFIMPHQTSPMNSAPSYDTKRYNEHWRFCIFELSKRQYHIFEDKMTANYNMPIDPDDQTLIV